MTSQDTIDLLITSRPADRRLSRASIKFFQLETSTRNLSLGSTASTRNLVASLGESSDLGLIDSEGKLRDDYILQRQSVNRPATLKKIPLLCDLTTASDITHVDGWVFAMLLVSGFSKMSSKTDELNTINVFPIADGDTGANMKITLKLPTRNLLLNAMYPRTYFDLFFLPQITQHVHDDKNQRYYDSHHHHNLILTTLPPQTEAHPYVLYRLV